jgi:hypothetical protein
MQRLPDIKTLPRKLSLLPAAYLPSDQADTPNIQKSGYDE